MSTKERWEWRLELEGNPVWEAARLELDVLRAQAAAHAEEVKRQKAMLMAQTGLVGRLAAKLRSIPDDDDAAIVALRDELLAEIAPTPSASRNCIN